MSNNHMETGDTVALEANATDESLSRKEAENLAKSYFKLLVDMRLLKKKREGMEADLRKYVLATGNTEFGGLMAYTKQSSPKLVTPYSGKKEARVLDALFLSIDDLYVNKKLDVKGIADNMDVDDDLAKVLRKLKVTVEVTESVYFKHVS